MALPGFSHLSFGSIYAIIGVLFAVFIFLYPSYNRILKYASIAFIVIILIAGIFEKGEESRKNETIQSMSAEIDKLHSDLRDSSESAKVDRMKAEADRTEAQRRAEVAESKLDEANRELAEVRKTLTDQAIKSEAGRMEAQRRAEVAESKLDEVNDSLETNEGTSRETLSVTQALRAQAERNMIFQQATEFCKGKRGFGVQEKFDIYVCHCGSAVLPKDAVGWCKTRSMTDTSGFGGSTNGW